MWLNYGILTDDDAGCDISTHKLDALAIECGVSMDVAPAKSSCKNVERLPASCGDENLLLRLPLMVEILRLLCEARIRL